MSDTSLHAYLSRLFACAPLQSKGENQAATQFVESLGFDSHHDPQKNWDAGKCLFYILANGDCESPVLDVGASRSVIMRWLSMLGYQDLNACDLLAKDEKYFKPHGIKFTVQDLTKTNYPSGHFQAITSISVIEHNVPLDAYLDEMRRLLRPGGLLLTSTDYWSEPVLCSGIFPYGTEAGEMRVFTPDELRAFCEMARVRGLELCQPLELETTERAVRWERVDREYTFAFTAMRKVS